ncbi:MFS transporter [Bacillus sp. JJ1562]|uniref:MFS transporter n=1 Tax=Bacillus sp. JJ1562 TaxID=3122960 RepID=UPI003003486A
MEKRKFWSYENQLTVIFFFAIGFVFFDRLAINYLYPFMQGDFAISNTEIGLASGALALTWSIASPLGGYLSDKVKNQKLLLAVIVILFSTVSLLHGFISTVGMLFFLRLMMGIAEGPIIPIAQSIMAIESSEKRRGFNTGITMNTSNAILGGLLAPIIVVALAEKFDWHMAFYLTIIPGIVLAFFILKTMKNKPDYKNSVAQAQEKVSFKQVLKTRNIWIGVILFSLYMTSLMAFQIYTPSFLVGFRGFTPSTMSIIMASFGLGYAIFGMVIPALSDRFGRKSVIAIFSLFIITMPLLIANLTALPALMLVVFFLPAGFSLGSIFMSTIPAESVSFKLAGAAIGIVTGLGELFGGFLSPIITGIAADQFGLQAPLFISAGAGVCILLVSFLLIESAPSKVNTKPAQDVNKQIHA